MTMMTRLYQTAAITTLLATSLGGAYAATTAPNDALGIAEVPISLEQAVAAAEQHIGGKASRAEYEREQGRSIFVVEVVKDSKVMDVQVDPTTGKVLSAMVDKVDHGDDEDRDEGHEAED
jgi:uncharacterized membrane protein YkoI